MELLQRVRDSRWGLPLVRLGFFTASIAVTAAAVMPKKDNPPELFPWDKANHFLAFYVLACSGVAGFPRLSPLVVGAALSALGGAIELLQMTPWVGRDGSVYDWLADDAAILAVLAPMALTAWRAGFPQPPR